jgi:hypothetical protein
MSTALGRVAAYLSRLQFVGLLDGIRVAGAVHHHGATDVALAWTLPDVVREGQRHEATIAVRLPDAGSEQEWDRAVLAGVADCVGHEVGESVLRDGWRVADPHARPRVWPWRARDRTEGGGE